MALIKAAAFPTGAPQLSTARIPTPPALGPLDVSHMWLAHAARGTASPSSMTSLPDMVGKCDLSFSGGANVWALNESAAPMLTHSGGTFLSSVGTTADNTPDRTLYFVGTLKTSGSQHFRLPGYTIGMSGAQIYVQGAYITVPVPATGPFVLTVVIDQTAKAAKIQINDGAVYSTLAGGTWSTAPTASLEFKFGSQVTTTDSWGVWGVYNRALTAAQITQLVTDCRTLYSI